MLKAWWLWSDLYTIYLSIICLLTLIVRIPILAVVDLSFADLELQRHGINETPHTFIYIVQSNSWHVLRGIEGQSVLHGHTLVLSGTKAYLPVLRTMPNIQIRSATLYSSHELCGFPPYDGGVHFVYHYKIRQIKENRRKQKVKAFVDFM